MKIIKAAISSHNTTILSTSIPTTNTATRKCNCRPNTTCPLTTCPLNGECLTSSIIYQATVETVDDKPSHTYIGLTEGPFKTRFNGHQHTFNHRNKRLSTELSKYVWSLKDKAIDFKIYWKVVKRSNSYNVKTKSCYLCTWEKYYIIFKPPPYSLNKRSEMLGTCRHAAK